MNLSRLERTSPLAGQSIYSPHKGMNTGAEDHVILKLSIDYCTRNLVVSDLLKMIFPLSFVP